MKIKNGDMPAMPLTGDAYSDFESHCYRGGSYNPECQGLTKREMFCLHMGVDETGDAELDDVIRKGNRQKMMMHIMAARASIPGTPDDEFDARRSVAAADALLAELERTK